jgi:hypothetical protein
MSVLLSEDTTGWPPEKIVFPVGRIELRVLDGDHPYHVEHAAAARDNWNRELAANPAFYDGRMLFQHRLSVSEEAITGESYVSPAGSESAPAAFTSSPSAWSCLRMAP